MTIYGVVCASCSPYFRPKQPCEICGQLSHRLTRVKRFGDSLRRCERCARADHRTCPSCQRHRKLSCRDGKELCNSCHTGELKPCIKCNKQIPITHGKLCKQCYWIKHLEKRLVINQTMLKSKQLKDDLSKFAQWLAQKYGFLKASLVIAQHSVFFKKIDNLWESFPNYSKLITKLGTSNLKEHKRILMWLEAEKGFVIDKNLKKNLTEEQYIRKMLDDIPNTSKIKSHILKYEIFLRERALQKQNTIRTIRYSLTPAIALMKMALVNNSSLPNQEVLTKYL